MLLITTNVRDVDKGGSILMKILRSNQRIEEKLLKLSDAIGTDNLGNRIQFEITPISKDLKTVFKAITIWPLPEKNQIDECTLNKSTLQCKNVSIEATSCDEFYIKINIDANNPKDPLEKFGTLASNLMTFNPSVNVKFSNGEKKTIFLYNFSAAIKGILLENMNLTELKKETIHYPENLNTEKIGNKKNAKNIIDEQKKIAIEKQRRENLKRCMTCTFTGCEIPLKTGKYLCEIGAKAIRIRRLNSTQETVIDLKKECTEADIGRDFNSGKDLCFSVPEVIPALKPSDEVIVDIEFNKEENISFSVIVEEDYNGPGNFTSVQNVRWIVLNPAEGEDPDTTPYAIAWFSPYLNLHTNPFQIGFGVGGCYPYVGKQYSSVLIDSDGKGLVEYGRGLKYLSAPEPKNGVIAIALETGFGKRYGPFRYAFDAEKIVENSAIESDVPRLSCKSMYDRNKKNMVYNCTVHMEPNVAIMWMKIKSIQIGSIPEELPIKFDINITARDIIDNLNSQGKYHNPNQRGIPIVKFDPPDEWSDLYYRLTLKSGKVLPLQRIRLK